METTSCRLCLEPCDFNDRLNDRNFREKAQDILVLYLKVDNDNVAIICDSCQSQIESFYQFKRKCRRNEKNRRNPGGKVLITGYAVKELDVVPPKKPRPHKEKDPNKPKKRYYKRLTDREWVPFTKEQLAIKPKEEWRKERKTRVCELCGKVLPNLIDLKTHMHQHRGERPFGCDEPDCGASFSSIQALKQHIVRIHSNEHHPCPECGKLFTSFITLRSHRRTHLEKPFACNFCDLRVRLKCQLKTHMLVHTQQRDHVCKFCGKAFYASTVLTLHLRSHTGERPYACHVCEFSHAHRILYVKHMQKFHPGEEIRTLAELQRLAAKATVESGGQEKKVE
ncbi:zinc finger protein 569 [Culex quinquefasciatus]|uniref:zinc finger protein 569 n=1 Tax=Culex quinquefasciatus TaxID=7176 RepID=UPI0018E36F27|nr:zinc finger protein 569 [Culex quinquefasciatus]